MKPLCIAFGVLLAVPVGAADLDWNNCSGTNARAVSFIQPGQSACFEPAANTDDSKILGTGTCENVDVFSYDDKDGDGTVSTVGFTIQHCPDTDSNLNTTTKRDNACDTLPGVGALSGDDAESNLALNFLRITSGGSGNNPGDARVIAKCALRAN